MSTPAAPAPTRLADYQPPDYRIETVDLDVSLDPSRTIVKSRLVVHRAPTADATAPLVLDGERLDLISVRQDGDEIPKNRRKVDENGLTLDGLPASFTLDIESACAPEANTALSGLYLSNGMFCTQCEAEGFRRITYFLDRPDVLARYTVRIEADKSAYPVLLSNGNLTASGEMEHGRHFAQWADPHPKPSYLFALVGGDLACVDDAFTTRSGREVTLKVFVQPENKDKCAYTLDALKRAMRWDEETFGREYDLDIFMIVAVDHFNFGAMENKGLNIFNSAYVLASPQTATDADYETIESIVAHEYFHNWSGNRVTCRDWFQLCLKEGFTVFRDQEFSADMRSRPVQRIKDVRRLWAHQFPEDSGPLAHPPRPDEYITIDNFYTATVYEKGAELARMLKTLLGPEKFRAASDLYFTRHDGSAATVEDFVTAMEDAGEVDLRQFRLWYTDAGRPTVRIKNDGDAFSIAQHIPATPGRGDKPARHIPISYAAYGAKSGIKLAEGRFDLREDQKLLKIAANESVVLSPLRGFSAPASIDYDISIDDRLMLMAHDDDPFNRWSVVNGLWRDLCLGFAGTKPLDDQDQALDKFGTSLARALEASIDDPAFAAELLKPPSPSELAQTASIIQPAAIVAGRRQVVAAVAASLSDLLRATHQRLHATAPYSPDAKQAGGRALKNAALALLVAADDDALALRQAAEASNMTDEAAAVFALATSESAHRSQALNRFYDKWRHESLVVNKWLSWRALNPGAAALDEVVSLLNHDAFDPGNPNKVRALIGAFGRENIASLHREDGAGYEFFIGQIEEIDKKNPQLAARLAGILENWRRLAPPLRDQASSALSRLADPARVSKNLFEMVDRLLSD